MTLASRRSPDTATAYMRVRLLLINAARDALASAPTASDPGRHYLRCRQSGRLVAPALYGVNQTISREASRLGVAVDPRSLVLALAGAACAVKHDLVIVGAEIQAARETVDRQLQIAIVKRHHPPARVTQQVMMVLAPRIDQLIPRRAVPKLQPRDQPMLAEQLQDPVDARPRDPLVALTQSILDLQRSQRARLIGEQIDQRVARPPLLMPSPVEHPASVIPPFTPDPLSH